MDYILLGVRFGEYNGRTYGRLVLGKETERSGFGYILKQKEYKVRIEVAEKLKPEDILKAYEVSFDEYGRVSCMTEK